jgi:hypothetical protein
MINQVRTLCILVAGLCAFAAAQTVLTHYDSLVEPIIKMASELPLEVVDISKGWTKEEPEVVKLSDFGPPEYPAKQPVKFNPDEWELTPVEVDEDDFEPVKISDLEEIKPEAKPTVIVYRAPTLGWPDRPDSVAAIAKRTMAKVRGNIRYEEYVERKKANNYGSSYIPGVYSDQDDSPRTVVINKNNTTVIVDQPQPYFYYGRQFDYQHDRQHWDAVNRANRR